MEKVKITFPDGQIKEFDKGISSLDIAKSLSQKLAAEAVAATVNGNLVDINSTISENSTLKLHTFESEEGKHAFWHTSAHIMAEALEALFPGIKFGIGPAVENGFYYDVDLPEENRRRTLRTRI